MIRRPATKKISTVQAFGNEIFKEQKLTIGVDLGDRWSFYCILDEAGKVILEQKASTTPEAMKQSFSRIPQSRIALETATHSPWVSRLSTELGHEVIVVHAQKVHGSPGAIEEGIDTMHGHWQDWRESIPSDWGRCGIAVCKRKSI
jgi:hypothetical protein